MIYANTPTNNYRGRFAPSPSGPLHFGSLVCALASFLDAKHHQGKWLIRIEDIDKQRCHDTFHHQILETLEHHQLIGDTSIVKQSDRLAIYQDYLDKLIANNMAYACDCTRASIKKRSLRYDAFCAHRGLQIEDIHAIRLRNTNTRDTHHDQIQGNYSIEQLASTEDIVLRRRDMCFAYNLVVVADDIEQKITHVVRGADLLDMTPIQAHLFEIFKAPVPHYSHIPVVSTQVGLKLSKQNHAKAISNSSSLKNLMAALVYLGFDSKQVHDYDSIESLMRYAVSNWQIIRVSKQREILISASNTVYSPFVTNTLKSNIT